MHIATQDHPLRKWRKAEGLTLEQAASRVGTVRQVWSDWERGRRRPSGDFMPKVRDLTGGKVTADDFFPSIKKAA
ncbi:helix-turn-helix transcriptional regulator [Novosphingobium sp.]|uniref:helix-turn-helix domain-containing protein n=1 Tax=Novosphingobium sp. TaxID=1874826 RepID=UPI00286DEFDD|nr:helix-turn-helix transcriptional regulator [Novosphingobium sp.]